LVAVFQILTIYAVNVQEARVTTAAFVLLIALAATTLIFLFLSLLTSDAKRAAMVVTFCCFLFFVYGRLYETVLGFQISGFVIGRAKCFLPFYALLVVAGSTWIFCGRCCKERASGITYFLNVFSFGLVLVAFVTAVSGWERLSEGAQGPRQPVGLGSDSAGRQGPETPPKERTLQPNVYYLVFDSYASPRVLQRYYRWDDGGLVGALRSRGFSVENEAYSNYPFTCLSRCATLNMRYIHEDGGFREAKSKWGYVTQRTQENEVVDRFKSEGYDVLSNVEDYRWPDDRRRAPHGGTSLLSDEFVGVVINVSLLRVIGSELVVDARRREILSILEGLKRFDVPSRPTFVWLHILCPHYPYMFNADGSRPKLSVSVRERLSGHRGYIEQVRFVGTQIIEIVDGLRCRDPGAIIVVQADHGNGGILGAYGLSHQKPPPAYIDAQFGILNATWSPANVAIPGGISPVNLFRCLFNALFGAGLEMLPDKAFFTGSKEPWVFYNVTEDLKKLKDEQD
jgi:hypothetical protein